MLEELSGKNAALSGRKALYAQTFRKAGNAKLTLGDVIRSNTSLGSALGTPLSLQQIDKRPG
jgi:hypothetical protein